MACKRFLGVPVRTPSKKVYGDLGRFPLLLIRNASSVRYSFQLLEMKNDKLKKKRRKKKKVYEMLLCLEEMEKTAGDLELENFCVELE